MAGKFYSDPNKLKTDSHRQQLRRKRENTERNSQKGNVRSSRRDSELSILDANDKPGLENGTREGALKGEEFFDSDSDEMTKKGFDWTISQGSKIPKVNYVVILPNSSFRTNWDSYIGCLIIYIAIFVPYRVSFIRNTGDVTRTIDMIMDISFGIDILLNFITAYESNGVVVRDLRKIAKRYIKGFFFMDLIATFPFELITAELNGGVNQASKLSRLPRLIKFLRMARMLKLLRVYRLQKFIRDAEIMYNVHQGISRLCNIVVIILIATHVVGCLWHTIGVGLDIQKADDECTNLYDELLDDLDTADVGWVCREHLTNHSPGHKYIASIYWAFSTLTTVGYGDISARTIWEQFYSMLMMLLGVSWYAFVVGSMTSVVASFDRQNKLTKEKMLQVSAFCRETKLPNNLATQIRRYFEYACSRKKNGLFGFDADEIMHELSSTLRTDVICFVEKDLIDQITFFEGKNRTFVASAIQFFQPVVVHEGDFIIKEGSAADEMYFLINGNAAIFYADKKVQTLLGGSYFGEIGCILGGIRRAGVLAVTTCELQCLSKTNLNLLLLQHPEIGDELKGVARDRMNKVRTKQTENIVAEMKNLLERRKPKVTLDESVNELAHVTETPKINTPPIKVHIPDKRCDYTNTVPISENTPTKKSIALVKETSCAIEDNDFRRLSMTSGSMSYGNHIHANETILRKMNEVSISCQSKSQEHTFPQTSLVNGITTARKVPQIVVRHRIEEDRTISNNQKFNEQTNNDGKKSTCIINQCSAITDDIVQEYPENYLSSGNKDTNILISRIVTQVVERKLEELSVVMIQENIKALEAYAMLLDET
mmetsp:Transcript_50304/g.60493  ORF Transcript_50304/g.60493 Transcript_50304/m.60493 type:complete len:827 (-) Transcript_50304:108-2588(-)